MHVCTHNSESRPVAVAGHRNLPSTSPSVRLSDPSFPAWGENWRIFQNWWNKYVQSQWSWWNESVDAIRVQFNEVVRSDTPDGQWYRDRIGDCSDMLFYYWGEGCMHASDVEAILVCYHNLAKAKSIPEYARGLPDKTRGDIYRAVATCSGYKYHEVMLVLISMHKLFNATPSTVHVAVIYPLAWQRQTENRETPNDIDTIGSWFKRASENLTKGVEEILNVLKWAAIIAGLAAIGYVGFQIYQGAKSAE